MRQIIVLPPRICEVSSKKRQQVISLVALGATNAQIAEEMGNNDIERVIKYVSKEHANDNDDDDLEYESE